MKILVIGAGYVGLSNALMLATKHKVTVIDIDRNKIKTLQKKISPIKDKLIEEYLKKDTLKISFQHGSIDDLNSFKVVLIATPTNFDTKSNFFDTKSIQNVLNKLKKNNYKNLVINRSTVPIGYTAKIQKKYKFTIAYFPEFLREGQALKDNLYPSRIICGSQTESAKQFLKILKNCSQKKTVKSIIVSSDEAESIKLFSNAYLAMRIAFFNEVDTFAMSKNLNANNLIKGISLDRRIGNYYNNPSFGYGGYCLPKDIKQLKANFINIPQILITATIQANKTRKKFIFDQIKSLNASKIGIYGLVMKSGSDNIRESAILDIIKALKRNKNELLIFEPKLEKSTHLGIKIEKNFDNFLKWSDLVVANRVDKVIEKSKRLVFSRDLFREN